MCILFYHRILNKKLKILKKKLNKWNKATDYVINYHIQHDTGIKPTDKLKGEMVYDEKFKDNIAEQVYKKLPDPPENEGNVS